MRPLRGFGSPFRPSPRSHLGGIVVLIAILVALPLLTGTSTYRLLQFDYILSLVMVAIGLNVVTGFAGQLSLGPSAVFAVGGYLAAYAANRYPDVIGLALMVLVGIVGATVFGVLVGLPSLRVGGFYLANVTLFFALLVPTVASNMELFGGSSGISLLANPSFIQSPTGVALYETCVTVVGVLVVASWALLHSRIGRHFAVIRTSDEFASALGIPAYRTKMWAFTLSSIPAGLGGAFYVFSQQFISPGSVSVDLSIYLVAACVVGGLGTPTGPLIGGAVVIGLSQFLGGLAQYQGLIFGTVLAVFAIALPEGVMGSGKEVLWAAVHNALPKGLAAQISFDTNSRIPLPAAEVRSPHPETALEAPRGVSYSQQTEPDRTRSLEVTSAQKHFAGVAAVSDVSLRVRSSTLHGLIGSNGSGKTTLLNLVSGFQKLDGGSVSLDGELLRSLPPWRRARAGIARTFQTPKLLVEETVLNNVLAGVEVTVRCNGVSTIMRLPPSRRTTRSARAKAFDALVLLGISDLADIPVRQISHGTRRMIELAIAMSSDPAFLLLDEPAAGLGPDEVQQLASAIQTLKRRGIGILLVEHNVPFVFELAEDVTMLHQGKVLVSGPTATVRADSRVAAAFLGADPASSHGNLDVAGPIGT